jgi:hypothetical protein
MVSKPDEIKARNRRLGLILATVALAFMVGFIVRLSFFGH